MTTPAAPAESQSRQKRVLLLGASGAIGQAAARALVSDGHSLVCFVRPGAGRTPGMIAGAEVRFGDAADSNALSRDGFRGEAFDAVVSCMASRTGAPEDAWAVDYQAHVNALACACAAGAKHFVLLSAICVQKPKLAFQHAKLKFEQELIASGLDYSIVRPTAFFKSLSGQVERVKAGKPYLVFGDGRLTSCKPISDDDLGRYLSACLTDDALRNRILPIGGPGPAITPRDQAEHLFALLGRPPRIAQTPPALMDAIIWMLSGLGTLIPALRAKAELARIGRYYATESMLVLNSEMGNYDADATPSTGSETLFDHYARLVSGEARSERGAHSVF